MATVVITPTAAEDLRRLVRTLSLPSDTVDRFKRSVEPLARFPLIGPALHGRWADYRFILGPWRWMLIVYVHDAGADRVSIVTIQDARSKVGTQHILEEADLEAIVGRTEGSMPLPDHWKVGFWGGPMPDWAAIVREQRDTH